MFIVWVNLGRWLRVSGDSGSHGHRELGQTGAFWNANEPLHVVVAHRSCSHRSLLNTCHSSRITLSLSENVRAPHMHTCTYAVLAQSVRVRMVGCLISFEKRQTQITRVNCDSGKWKQHWTEIEWQQNLNPVRSGSDRWRGSFSPHLSVPVSSWKWRITAGCLHLSGVLRSQCVSSAGVTSLKVQIEVPFTQQYPLTLLLYCISVFTSLMSECVCVCVCVCVGVWERENEGNCLCTHMLVFAWLPLSTLYSVCLWKRESQSERETKRKNEVELQKVRWCACARRLSLIGQMSYVHHKRGTLVRGAAVVPGISSAGPRAGRPGWLTGAGGSMCVVWRHRGWRLCATMVPVLWALHSPSVNYNTSTNIHKQKEKTSLCGLCVNGMCRSVISQQDDKQTHRCLHVSGTFSPTSHPMEGRELLE